MAPGDSLRLDDEIVCVACKDGKYFNIHKNLLVDNCRAVKIHRRSDGSLHANIDAEFDAVETFTRWLYIGRIPKFAFGECEDPAERVDAALEAHALARVIGSVGFMGACLDEAINEVVAFGDCIHTHEILNSFAAEFVVGSSGRKFAVDFVYHKGHEVGTELTEITRFEDLRGIQDDETLTELVKLVVKVMGFKIVEATVTHDAKKMLLSGFFDARECIDDIDLGPCPWEEDKCQYHRHKELKVACYTKDCGL